MIKNANERFLKVHCLEDKDISSSKFIYRHNVILIKIPAYFDIHKIILMTEWKNKGTVVVNSVLKVDLQEDMCTFESLKPSYHIHFI